SSEQSAGVGQVGEAVTQMDQATQQNAALVEEMAAAASALNAQAGELVNAVAVFKLDANVGHTGYNNRHTSSQLTGRSQAARNALPGRAPAAKAKVSLAGPTKAPASVTHSAPTAAAGKGGDDEWDSF
ncbi:MAG: methyl-accepting chemotaxis protein, partial [Burkholderiaceae bacterium]|nr:methyl-accepting chemotaxis protein [Burkholderiaceae bacterium]